MDKFIIDIPTKVSLRPFKQPCKEVNFSGDIIEWVNDKKQKIEADEIDEFLKDTAQFVNILGIEVIQSMHDKRNYTVELKEKIYDTINFYYKKWGTFVKSRDNKITLKDLCLSCYTVYISLNLWNNGYILDNLKNFLNPDNLKGDPEEGKIVSWYSGLVHYNEKNWIWLSETKDVYYSGYSSYCLRIRQPKTKEYNIKYRNNDEELNKYIKGEILKSISNYMSKQLDTKVYSINFIRGYFSFDLFVDNRLLAYLIYSIPEFLKEEIKLCECGCGGLVIGNRKLLPGHIEKKRKNQDDRILKAWIRTRKNRGLITPEQYESYSALIDEELQKGANKNDIRKKIQCLMKDGE